MKYVAVIVYISLVFGIVQSRADDSFVCQPMTSQSEKLIGSMNYELIEENSQWTLLVKPEGSDIIFQEVALEPAGAQTLKGGDIFGEFLVNMSDDEVSVHSGEYSTTCEPSLYRPLGSCTKDINSAGNPSICDCDENDSYDSATGMCQVVL